ncbi:hypothetical protein B0H14DRAFT_3527593 [Mycena olivaceomarginata]|nr:hypothetical protein B0H14DRAFT_3527593 [Mycena olivaceomarginata]
MKMDDEYPPGRGDNQAWYVICVGRQPGFYVTSRKRKTKSPVVPRAIPPPGCRGVSALAYYRSVYDQGKLL